MYFALCTSEWLLSLKAQLELIDFQRTGERGHTCPSVGEFSIPTQCLKGIKITKKQKFQISIFMELLFICVDKVIQKLSLNRNTTPQLAVHQREVPDLEIN